MNLKRSNSATWLTSQGFTGVQGSTGVQLADYWSASTSAFNNLEAWNVNMVSGMVVTSHKGADKYVWPVRGGQ